MQKPRKISVTINRDKYQCWKCRNETTPVKGYNFLISDLQSLLVAKFCSNRQCNLLWAYNASIQQDGGFTRAMASWDNGTAYWKMPNELRNSYAEACKCFVSDCYRATALICRTMIAHAAQAHGASKKYGFQESVDYLVRENLIAGVSEYLLDEVSKIGGKAAHTLTEITEHDALKVLLTLDMELKEIHIQPMRMENGSVGDWFVVLIMAALNEMCGNIITLRILATLRNSDSVCQKLISKLVAKMFAIEACKQTARELMSGNHQLGAQGYNNILKSGVGVACMDYLKSRPELLEIVAKHSN